MIAMNTHLSAAASVGKWPRALTARRIRALMDSMAFVVHTTVRMWLSNCRNGTNSAHADSHNLMIAGIPVAPLLAEGDERVQGGRFAGCGVDRLEVLGDRRPVLLRGVAETVSEEVDEARLRNRLRPNSFDRLRQP